MGRACERKRRVLKEKRYRAHSSDNDDISLTGSGMLGTSHGQHQGASDRS